MPNVSGCLESHKTPRRCAISPPCKANSNDTMAMAAWADGMGVCSCSNAQCLRLSRIAQRAHKTPRQCAISPPCEAESNDTMAMAAKAVDGTCTCSTAQCLGLSRITQRAHKTPRRCAISPPCEADSNGTMALRDQRSAPGMVKSGVDQLPTVASVTGSATVGNRLNIHHVSYLRQTFPIHHYQHLFLKHVIHRVAPCVSSGVTSHMKWA